MIRVAVRIAPDHPGADGHFPDNPIVPAAVLLDEVLGTIERAGSRPPRAWTVTGAKFLHPVRPGEELQITFEARADGDLQFECSVGERTVVTGRVRPSSGEPV